MPLIRKPMRYAHPEGHTDVCYFTEDKGRLITCGTDGDVRSWVNLMDDDPSASCVSEQATIVVSKNGKLYVGTDNNTVQILNHPELEKEGIVTRFSATVSALATAKNSNLIVSGSCDMKIQVSNISTKDNFELSGHEAPVFGLSLDPQEEFITSSSGDGTVRVWSIKDKRSVHTWNNVVPKCNSFFTAKVYGVPSFSCKNGEYLAYPQGREVIVVERSSWKEVFKLRSVEIKNELSICKFSDCGTMLAASSSYGEVIVWNVESKELVGYVEHQQNAKITSLAWHPHEPKELAFCDALGQLSCIEVQVAKEDRTLSDLAADPIINGDTADSNLDFNDTDDEDDDNVISLSKIKASVALDEDQKTVSDVATEKKDDEKNYMPEINLQEPFQPGSSPSHLLSRYMVWNDVGIVMCFTSEDREDSNIEVNFHDFNVHHSMHMINHLQHTMAALSSEALVLAGPPSHDTPSKIVVIALQGWGSGTKEWTMDLPDGEAALAVAAGSNFVAVATSLRTLRIFMTGGTQREVIALPGPVVAMNGYGNNLAVAYHSSIGTSGDQIMSLLWIRVSGTYLKNNTLPVPLSPAANLMWLGFSDLGSPIVMDADGIINIFDRKSSLWRIAANTNRMSKGKFDNYFIIGISESDRSARCILCKGSHYPPTAPRPIVGEIPLTIPLCEPGSEKTEKESVVWQLGSNPTDEKEAVLALIAAAMRNNAEFRAVDLVQQIASQKVIELAIKYARHMNKVPLARKFETIADNKDFEEDNKSSTQEDMFKDCVEPEEEEPVLLTPSFKTPDVEIKPLTPSPRFGRRSNPFLKKNNTLEPKGLLGLDEIKEPPKIAPSPIITPKSKPTKPKTPAKESFVYWFSNNKANLEKKMPDLSATELTKKAFAMYNNISKDAENSSELEADDAEAKRKRKIDEVESSESNEPKRSVISKLSAFARDN
ncbi:WD repeat and HMG-box DNA-binding protein 1 [Copidosoma floridanum]|uniref:WD repeat and HMG-box DNA-binding protein 1 n=1 Tax=Copidosoma floridanum TaxID=29053 RepID=UPI0006C9C762|nr:WD repeat and HMG-box DNA-binding protein 1 [Copidosoma floridanum]